MSPVFGVSSTFSAMSTSLYVIAYVENLSVTNVNSPVSLSNVATKVSTEPSPCNLIMLYTRFFVLSVLSNLSGTLIVTLISIPGSDTAVCCVPIFLKSVASKYVISMLSFPTAFFAASSILVFSSSLKSATSLPSIETHTLASVVPFAIASFSSSLKIFDSSLIKSDLVLSRVASLIGDVSVTSASFSNLPSSPSAGMSLYFTPPHAHVAFCLSPSVFGLVLQGYYLTSLYRLHINIH